MVVVGWEGVGWWHAFREEVIGLRSLGLWRE